MIAYAHNQGHQAPVGGGTVLEPASEPVVPLVYLFDIPIVIGEVSAHHEKHNILCCSAGYKFTEYWCREHIAANGITNGFISVRNSAELVFLGEFITIANAEIIHCARSETG